MLTAFICLTVVSLGAIGGLGFLHVTAMREARDERRQLLNRLAVAQAGRQEQTTSYVVPPDLGEWEPGPEDRDPLAAEDDPDADELALVGTVQPATGEENPDKN
jgi:hypothetical protein